MKITIITVTKSDARTIQQTIDSVQFQSYPHIEYIVIDGNSDDSTLEIIQKNSEFIDQWISEKDKGIYDAMNKGIQMATGEIISFLNADDFFTYREAVSDMVECMIQKKADSCYADIEYVDRMKTDKILRSWTSGEYQEDLFLKGWMPPHPTFFVRKKIYEKYGTYNLACGTAADYEIMLRFLHKYNISVAYLPKSIIRMRVGGVSNASWINRLKANKNDRKAWKINGLKPKFYTLWLKPLKKVSQFI